jgi:hypothetical protein
MAILLYIYIQYSLAYLQSSVTFVGGVCPVTVSLLVLCKDVRVASSFEASMLSVGWHVLWNVTDKRVRVKYKG